MSLYRKSLLAGKAIAVGVGVVLAGAAVLGVERVGAQPAGSTVTFLVRTGLSVATGPSGDNVIVMGQPAASVQVTGCAIDLAFYPVQSVILVDPGAGRPTRLENGFITISQTTPLQNGFRLEDLAPGLPPSCTANAGMANQQTYDKYTGTAR